VIHREIGSLSTPEAVVARSGKRTLEGFLREEVREMDLLLLSGIVALLVASGVTWGVAIWASLT
jgi:hypothetical protein